MFEEDFLDTEYFGWLKGRSSIQPSNQLQVIQKYFRNQLRLELRSLLYFEESDGLDTDVKLSPITQDKPIHSFEEDSPMPFSKDKIGKVPSDQDKENNLIIGLVLRDNKAYIDLYETEFSKIKALVVKNSGSLEDAKDVFQEAVVLLVEKLSQKGFKFTSKVSTYLYSVARYLWINELKTRSLHANKLEQLYDTCDVYVVDYNFDSNKEDGLLLKLSHLGETCLKLLEYYYYKNWEWKDIAIELGYSTPASARNQKFKCLKKIGNGK